MTVGELRTILSGFPEIATVNLLAKPLTGDVGSIFAEIQETNYDVDAKILVLEGYEA